jgi:hypothetical protein
MAGERLVTGADGSQWRRSMTIEEYIACPKVIERKRRPAFKAENRHYRKSNYYFGK